MFLSLVHLTATCCEHCDNMTLSQQYDSKRRKERKKVVVVAKRRYRSVSSDSSFAFLLLTPSFVSLPPRFHLFSFRWFKEKE